jgi:HPt (histidine-containing phosphotransfer) domain-containing protein
LDVKAGLERCGRDEDRFLKILAVFAQDAEQLKEALTEPLEGQASFKELAVTVHALKSGASYVGAEKIAQKAAELEKAAQANDSQYITKAIGPLRDELSQIASFIQETLGRAGWEAKKAPNV